MLILRSSPSSPFGRKVKIAADLLGLSGSMTVQPADTLDPNEPLRQQNPLGKIPVLILDDGTALYDSRVIVAYLDHLVGGGKIIPSGATRFEVLRQEALADGITDAALLQVYESRFRAEDRREAKWLEHQAGKVERGLAFAEDNLSEPPAAYHVGHIALACALGYLDLRFQGSWRTSHPKLVAWLADFERRVPAYEQTRVKS